MDFGSFVASGRAAAQGLNPYGIYPLTFHVSFPGFEAWNPNLNPPISALLFQLFDRAEPDTSFRIWWAISGASYLLAALLVLCRYPERDVTALACCAVGLAGFSDTLVLGQIYLPLVLLAVCAWLLLERGLGVAAGILIGMVVAMKPNFALWPVILALAGCMRPAATATVVAGAISAVPALVYGPEIYRQWLELVLADGARAGFLTNASLPGLATRIGLPGLGLICSAALIGLAAWWARRRRPDAILASTAGILLSLVASPLAWVHYTLFLLPVLACRWGRLSTRLVTALLLVPVPVVIAQFGAPPLAQATLGSVYNWALLWLACALVLEEARPGAQTERVPRTAARTQGALDLVAPPMERHR